MERGVRLLGISCLCPSVSCLILSKRPLTVLTLLCFYTGFLSSIAPVQIPAKIVFVIDE